MFVRVVAPLLLLLALVPAAAQAQSNVNFDTHYYNSFGASLETGGGSYIFLEGRDMRWQLTDYIIAGTHLGVTLMEDNWVPSFSLEATYLYDYGAQFVPYAGAASGLSLAVVTVDEETTVETGFVGFGRVGALWFFNTAKTSGLYTDLVVDRFGNSDFRVGFVFEFEK